MSARNDFSKGIQAVAQLAGAELVEIADVMLGVGTASQAHGKQTALATCHGEQGHIVLVFGSGRKSSGPDGRLAGAWLSPCRGAAEGPEA
jgi:hypothetical protein